jgi:hexosaminidase
MIGGRIILESPIITFTTIEPIVTKTVWTNVTMDWLHDLPVWPLVKGKSLGTHSLHLTTIQFVHDVEWTETIQHAYKPEPANYTIHILVGQSTSRIPTKDNEIYTLELSPSGGVIKANSRFGLIRALATLHQLMDQPLMVPLLIVDQPTFAHRGLLLDTARSYYSVDSILRIIRTLGMTKMNVLHWHFADDQSYGFESRAIPEVTSSTYPNKRAGYTYDDIKRVVEEGRRWGVRIIPELDMPSHAAGWLAAGILTRCPRYACDKAWGIAINPYLDRTWVVLEAILKEMTQLFPDPVLHLGGDEVFKACWEEDPQVMKVSRDTEVHWAYFERRLDQIVSTLNRTIIRWEDCRRFYEQIKRNVTFQVWGGWGDFRPTLERGHQLIGSQRWYLDNDCMNWEECYRTSPLEALRFPPDQIHGLEACAWELAEEDLDKDNLWMRFLGVAEHMWSYRQPASMVTDPTRRRILHLCQLLAKQGVFPPIMCVDNQPKVTIKRQRGFLIRSAERDQMICRRMAGPMGRCTTHNCIRERIH